MQDNDGNRAVAIVGMSAIMPEAPDAAAFWRNITGGRYCITDVPSSRWDPSLYYDPDPAAPEKSYSRIGGWVREFEWNPLGWRMPIPPKVSEQMDQGQQWAINLTRAALMDVGWPDWQFEPERTAVIVGNAIGGEKHYDTSMRIQFPEFARELRQSPSFRALGEDVRTAIIEEARRGFLGLTPPITEDTMPGELANCIAGRIANLFNMKGPNFTTDAACASAMAAMNSAIEGLLQDQFDVAVTGGIDRNMGIAAFVKFCKIGALSATGTRPYADGADGFVMGEGGALFVLKRIADAERDGNHIYAVVRGMAGSSDGKGKGITAPNPAGQRLAVERAWRNAGMKPSEATLIEGHGTSTKVGDVVEIEALQSAFGTGDAVPGSIALGSVKSNIGHLKAAAGAAGIFKTAMALSDKVLPPSVNFHAPNPSVDWSQTAFRVNTELRDWKAPPGGVRIAGVSAFGFGGTNFHAVLEEYVPGRIPSNGRRSFAVSDVPATQVVAAPPSAASPTQGAPAAAAPAAAERKAPLRGALVVGGSSAADLAGQLDAVAAAAASGQAPQPAPPDPALADAPLRLAIDYADAADLAGKAEKAKKALATDSAAMWKMLRSQGVFRGSGPAPKAAFLYTGQGSQYVNMLQDLRAAEPIVADTFAEADRIMTPLLGKPLTDFIFIDADDPEAVKQLEQQLLQTEITQPAVLATDLALTRLLDAYGIRPDMVMGHSLGEYGALVAAGSLTFEAALEAVSARGREMASLTVDDNGAMAAVFAPLVEVERVVAAADGYVVIANVNSNSQAVIGGATVAVERTVDELTSLGHTAIRIPVSHAFHTSIVAPASAPLKVQLARLDVRPPALPLVANVTGDFYPREATVEDMLDILGRQVASPVQFVRGLHTLYDAGARVFVEVGPKKALHGFAEDVLGGIHDDVLALFTNHPKQGGVPSFNQALCGLYAAGYGLRADAVPPPAPTQPVTVSAPAAQPQLEPAPTAPSTASPASHGPAMTDDRYNQLGRLFADFLEQGRQVYEGASPAPASRPVATEPVVITGAALGLPGTERVFDDRSIGRILKGESFIDLVPSRLRKLMADKHITRLVKREQGDPTFETIDSTADVIKLAGRFGAVDAVEDFGIEPERAPALDRTDVLAIGAGFDALRDAGIPLTLHYKDTTLGTKLPDRWGLPAPLRDDTGVIFASAFPSYDSFAVELNRYHEDRARREQLAALEDVRARMRADDPAAAETDRRIRELQSAIEEEPFVFDRRFLFRVLSMGHSQFAEIIGARGPNTQLNAACASTTQALGIAEDWITSGRCRRVVVVAADDVTSDTLLPWTGSGFLATGAAATDDTVEEAALPFDARRHGMLLGAGAAALVVESAEAARERGIQPICEVLSTVIANSAFHGTRLDISHIGQVMERLVRTAEGRGVDRHTIAAQTAFVSHETYTPARGGSASAEINALRSTFGPEADRVVITNTKGFTGHAMGAGIEDVVAVKLLETGVVPPVANFKEVDPDLGVLNLSRGGAYPVEYSLRLAAGFGSQIAMALLRWTPMPDRQRRLPSQLGHQGRIIDAGAWQRWLSSITGYPQVELEVHKRRLRVVDQGPPAAAPTVPTVSAAPAARQIAAPAPVRPLSPAASPGLVPDMPVPGTTVAPPAAATVAAADQPVASEEPAPAASGGASTAPPAPPVPEPALDPVASSVLEMVSGMTGYPTDLLDPDLDLEADLGVDTVKQAEVFAAVRETFDIPQEDDLRLRDFPTLNHVIGFVHDKGTNLPQPSAAAPVAPAATAPTPRAEPATRVATPVSSGPGKSLDRGDPVAPRVLAIAAEMTGYPTDLLGLDLDLEADLGIDTVKQAEVFAAVRSEFDIERDDALRLRDFPTLNHVIGFVHDRAHRLPDDSGGMMSFTPAVEAAVPHAETGAEAPPEAGDPVVGKVLDIVSEMTGYPTDLLDPDLDLEADLGVDTVKQAEVFAAVRETFDIPREDNLQLRDFPTLSHVVGFVRDRARVLPAPAVPAAAAAPAPAAAPAAAPAVQDEVVGKVLQIVSDMTGYPPDLLDLDLDLEADLGVDTVKQAEVFVAVRGEFDIPRDDDLQLRDFPTLTDVIGFVRDRATNLPARTQGGEPGAQAPVLPAPSGDPVVAEVLAIVSDMTGYPPDLLDLDLDLEADLGVDTVKQAEVFAAVRARYDIPRDDDLQLRDFPTLNHVLGFVYERATNLDAATEATAAAEPEKAEPDAQPAVAGLRVRPSMVGELAATDRLPRRVPVPVLRPALDACKSTGVSLAGSRVVVMRDSGGVGEALVKRLEKAGATALVLEPGIADAELVERLDAWTADGGIQGVYWLPALDEEGPITDLDLAGWREALRRRVKNLYTTMRHLYEHVSGPGTFLVSATRLGGCHGYDEAGAVAPLGGAVTGFTKAYKREQGDALVKAVDFPRSRKTAALAGVLIEETLRDPGAVEIGHADDQRWTVGLHEEPFGDGAEGWEFGPDNVFVVTGAAGSIVSAIVADLAQASGGVFHLLDLTPEPDPADADLHRFVADREGLKADIAARMKEAGERPTPVLIERQLGKFERLESALTAIQAVRDAGGEAHYHSVDLTDPAAVTAVIDIVRSKHGRIDCLLHAAGLEISRNLPDKERREYDLVFDVKSDGWFNLLRASADLPIGATVAFSSIAGRFGNAGQTDYSAANDLLCKITSSFRNTRPDTRGIALDWTAWGGIGMATRGSIPRIMEMAGIDMLPPEAGIAWIRRELGAGAFRGEVLVADAIGILGVEFDDTGGLEPTAVDTTGTGPMVGAVAGLGLHRGLTVATVLDPAEQGFLHDHRIDGIPVLPGVMGIEAFAETAQLLVPERTVLAVEDVRYLAPFKFYRDEPRAVVVEALLRREGKDLVADCKLIGERTLANQPEPQRTVHFTGSVRLSAAAVEAEHLDVPTKEAERTVDADAIYQVYFHGPAYQVLSSAWRYDGGAVGEFAADLPPNHHPFDLPTIMAPRLIELCYQTAGIWEIGQTGRMALPTRVGSVRVLTDPAGVEGPLFAVALPAEDGFACRVVDEQGNVVVRLDGYGTVELPGEIDEDLRTPIRDTMTGPQAPAEG